MRIAADNTRGEVQARIFLRGAPDDMISARVGYVSAVSESCALRLRGLAAGRGTRWLSWSRVTLGRGGLTSHRLPRDCRSCMGILPRDLSCCVSSPSLHKRIILSFLDLQLHSYHVATSKLLSWPECLHCLCGAFSSVRRPLSKPKPVWKACPDWRD